LSAIVFTGNKFHNRVNQALASITPLTNAVLIRQTYE